MERHLNSRAPFGPVRVFRRGRGAGFIAGDVGAGAALEAMSRLYFALHSYRPRDRNKFYYALAGWSFDSIEQSETLVEHGRRLVDHCEEFSGYFYLNGRITRPVRCGDLQ